MFEGTDLLELSDDELRHVRGERISVIFQDPLTSLHPLYRIGWQIGEMIRAHDKSVSKKEAADPLGRPASHGSASPSRRPGSTTIPHQFSGGMRQRAMIAMALALEPKLIIADEPTTALDATVQAQILDLLLRLQQDLGTALIMITHDLGVVADIADDVMVMYAGRAAEKAPKRDIFYHPHHPYTKGLLESIPSSKAAGGRLKPIPGPAAQPDQPPGGLQVPPAVRLRRSTSARPGTTRCCARSTRRARTTRPAGCRPPRRACRPRPSSSARRRRALGHERGRRAKGRPSAGTGPPTSGATAPGAAADNEGSVA